MSLSEPYSFRNHFKEPQSEEERRRLELQEQGRLARLERMREQNQERVIHESFERRAELLRQEREEKSIPKKVMLTNPRWEHVDQDIRGMRPDSVYIGETITLKVDQENGDSRPIEFQIKDSKIKSSIDPEKGVDEIQTKIESPSPSVVWTVLDPRSKKEADREMDVYLQVMSREIASDICKIHVLDTPHLQILEAEDCLFRHDSAAFLPNSVGRAEHGDDSQEEATGLAVLKTILTHAQENPEKKILLAGHTDRSGSDDYNFALSQKRADSIVALLEDDRDSWVTVVNESHTDEDIQHFMKWIARFKGWSCDPGAVDGIIGNNTKNAIKVFQEKSEITADGIIGPQSFGGIYDIIQESFTDSMSENTEALNCRSSLKWAYESKGVGCGEMFPITSEMKSQTDRRVEILFFEESELPTCVCVDGVCAKEDCTIYKDGAFQREYLEVDFLEKEENELNIRFEFKDDNESIDYLDDTYRLFSTDSQQSYNTTISVSACMEQHEDHVCITFKDIQPNLSYSLEVDDGTGNKEILLEDIPFTQLCSEE